jgi:YesN/AraC family two-component response regulator
MFFEKDSLSFHILDVLKIDQSYISTNNEGRNFSAISFRLCADTQLICDGKEIHVGDNSVTFFPARLPYRRISKKEEVIVVHLDCTDYHTDTIEFFESKDPERLARLFEDILREWNKKSTGYKYKCSAILYEILEECYVQNFHLQKNDSKIRASVELMHKDFADPELSIGKLAKRSFMSEVYFRKLFKEEYGISPQKYIIKLRVQYAMGLIATGYYSLKEVAALSGYTDYKYFSVEFKRAVGVSPSEYSYNYSS